MQACMYQPCEDAEDAEERRATKIARTAAKKAATEDDAVNGARSTLEQVALAETTDDDVDNKAKRKQATMQPMLGTTEPALAPTKSAKKAATKVDKGSAAMRLCWLSDLFQISL